MKPFWNGTTSRAYVLSAARMTAQVLPCIQIDFRLSQSKATGTVDYSALPYLIPKPVIGRWRVGLPRACYHKLPSTRSLGRSLGPKIHSRLSPRAGRWCERHEQSVVRWSRGGYGLTRRTVADPGTLHRSQVDANEATRPGMAPSPPIGPTGYNQAEAKWPNKAHREKEKGWLVMHRPLSPNLQG